MYRYELFVIYFMSDHIFSISNHRLQISSEFHRDYLCPMYLLKQFNTSQLLSIKRYFIILLILLFFNTFLFNFYKCK